MRSCWSPDPSAGQGLAKRLLQLRSLASTQSFERLLVAVPAMQQALDRVLRAKRFDLVNLEFSFLGECDLRQAPPNERPPRLVVDFAQHRLRARQTIRPRGKRLGPSPLRRRLIGASCGGKS